MASIIRDNSPPDAILLIGFSSSPLFTDIRISTLSIPLSVTLSCDISNTSLISGISRNVSSAEIRFASSSAAFFRLFVSSAASCFTFSPASFFFSVSSSIISSPLSISYSSVRHFSEFSSISESSAPYFLRSLNITLKRSS